MLHAGDVVSTTAALLVAVLMHLLMRVFPPQRLTCCTFSDTVVDDDHSLAVLVQHVQPAANGLMCCAVWVACW